MLLQALLGGLRAAALRAPPTPQLISCRSFAASAGAVPKAAALIIGNEILSGSITDTNTPWLAKLLYRCCTACIPLMAHTMHDISALLQHCSRTKSMRAEAWSACMAEHWLKWLM